MIPNQEITELLGQWSEGDREALDEVVALVYTELRERSRRLLAKERPEHTLQPTALVNELYLRLVRLKRMKWQNRTAFFGFAARVMRQVLVEHARAIGAQKRGGGAQRLDIEVCDLPQEQPAVDLLLLDELLIKLGEHDPVLVQIIELRFFGGLSEEEVAETLGVSRSTVQREWRVARRLLAQELRESTT